MKKLLILALMAFSLSSIAQHTLTLTSNGNPVADQAIFYYYGSHLFYSNGVQNPPTFEKANVIGYTDANGVFNDAWIVSDTAYFATRDCAGNFEVVSAAAGANFLNLNMSISCLPSDCDTYFLPDSGASTLLVKAVNLRKFSSTSLPTNVPSTFNYSNSSGSGTFTGLSSSDIESFIVPSSFYNAGHLNFCYQRVDSICTSLCDSLTIGNPFLFSPVACSPSYLVDTANSGLAQGQLILLENSSSNGNIISYDWDFGDGTTINAQYPSHNYTTVGVYNVCLTITAVDSTGIDTCVSTYCDTIGFDANGNLVYKGMTGFTINVIDPATVGLEDKVLESSLSLYPNPASDKAKLSWDASLNVQNIEVFSISGQKLIDFQPSGNTAEISGLESGAYLVRVSSKTASKTLRLIIE